jgi:AcrR family transcriptional regulator
MNEPVGEVRGAALTRKRLLEAGLEAFSTSGFDGISAREIERRAGLERGLVAYHFDSKEGLWKAVVDDLFTAFTDELYALSQALRDVSRHERARAMMLAYVRFNAERPEFFRVLVLEGHRRTERSRHLAMHLSRGVELFTDRPQDAGPVTVIEAIEIFQVIGASGTLLATTAYLEPEVEVAMNSPQARETFAQAVAARFLSRAPRAAEDDAALPADAN